VDALILRLTAGLAALFYRRQQFGGEVPASGPLIVVGNHVNGLVDPCLVSGVSPRPLRFLGKASIFEMPVLGTLVRWAGAIPVLRPGDKGHEAGNDDTFSAIFDALAAGDAICVFPEGTSHSDPSLRRLKTGAARMALGVEAAHGWSVGVRVLPVGLVYDERGTLRSQVSLWVGKPFGVDEWRAQHESDEWGAVESLTARIDQRLREVTLNLEHNADRALLQLAEQIRSADGEASPQALRRVADGLAWMRANRPERAAALVTRVREFGYRMHVHGLRPRDLGRHHGPWWMTRFVVREGLCLLVVVPVLAIGALVWAPPTLLVKATTAALPGDVDKNVTVALLSAVVFDTLWLALVVTLLALNAGWLAAVAAAVALPALGWAWLRLWGQREAHLHDIAAFLHLAPNSRLQDFLRRERDELRREFELLRRMIRAAEGRVA
jgi:1-acyl-sn-glycerol-3-phosphate acyltransferase